MAANKIRAGKAYVEIGGDDAKLKASLKSAQERMKAFGASLKATGVAMAAAGAAILAPLALAVRQASNMEEQMAKFGTVFGQNADVMRQWADEYSEAVGRSKRQTVEFLASSQDLFVPLGFAADQAGELSKQVTKLAVDLGSFNNRADADVLRDLQAALTGSGEVMKKYGVIVSEAAVKQELLNTGIDPKIATNQQKVFARLNIIMAGTTAAQGDAIRTSGSFANQMKRVKANLDDLSVTVGQALLPPLTELAKQFSPMIRAAGEWAKANADLIVTIAKIGAGAVAFGALTVGVGHLTTAIRGLATASAFLAANPVFAAITGGAVLGVGLGLALNKLTGYTAELNREAAIALERGDQQRAAELEQMTRLQQLARQTRLNSNEMSEASEIIDGLNSKYGDLGLSIDRTTGIIMGLSRAQRELNREWKAAELLQVEAAIARQRENVLEAIKELKNKEENHLIGPFRYFFGTPGQLREARRKANVQLDIANKEFAALLARRDVLKTGPGSTVAGGVKLQPPDVNSPEMRAALGKLRKAMETPLPSPVPAPLKEKVRTITDQIAGLQSPEANRAEVFGSFSTAGLALMGFGRTLQERTAQAAEQLLEVQKQMLGEIRDNLAPEVG